MPRPVRACQPPYWILASLAFVALMPNIADAQGLAYLSMGRKLTHEYEKQAGLGSTPELDRISTYIDSVGNRVAGALPSHHQYHFIFDPNPAFKSAFALPGGYIIVGGGLLALTQTEDELANALAHEIAHVELGQVRNRITDLIKRKNINKIDISDFLPSYGRQQELACDLKGQQLAAKAGYSARGMLTLLETFKALRRGAAEEPSERSPTLSERIAQANRLASTATVKQRSLRVP